MKLAVGSLKFQCVGVQTSAQLLADHMHSQFVPGQIFPEHNYALSLGVHIHFN
jgi:hypothetical protein